MRGSELLIVIMPTLMLFAMIFGIVYLKTRENMALIEKGINPKDRETRPSPYKSLKAGLLLIGAGVGLLLASFLSMNIGNKHDDHMPGLYFALIALGGGIGLIISYVIEKKQWRDKTS